MSRWFIFVVVVLLLAGAACYSYWASVMSLIAQRDADARIAFAPLEHLRPGILQNGFGVFHVEFEPESKLTDDNAGALLSLNRLPAEYDLTLWLKTSAITDASVSVLVQLTTTDTIVIAGAGLTQDGIERLAVANPNTVLLSRDGKRLARSVENK